MKKISIDYKFTIDIDEKYFDDNYYNTENESAIIMLRAECENISVEDLVNVIICCTFDGNGLFEKPINRRNFKELEIYLTIAKTSSSFAKYEFKITNYNYTEDVLLAIARNIIL